MAIEDGWGGGGGGEGTLSEETKALISLSMLSSIKVKVIDKETNTTVNYDSITAAATALNIRIQAICNYLKRNQVNPPAPFSLDFFTEGALGSALPKGAAKELGGALPKD
uniref:Nuclease-associated modular DNA-binding 1 domain-containing protein n=1 Tax=Morchella brunnea TaxID=1174671 RepID=A0A8K1MII1_9PEZI|nr:hypothetical protein LK370_mgp211 [Morchella brunnea]UBU98492.1 hypothetical protein [Morchella brunnea]